MASVGVALGCLSLTAWATVGLVRIRLAGGQSGGHVKVPEGASRDLLTCLIGPRDSGWDVTRAGDGRLPLLRTSRSRSFRTAARRARSSGSPAGPACLCG
jgi:hypothetical protein